MGNQVLNSRWLNHWKWLVPDTMRGSWIFCQRVFELFLQPNVLLKISKITVKVGKNKQIGSILTCQSQQRLLILNCSKSAKWPDLKFVFLQSWRNQIWTAVRPHLKDTKRYWCHYLIITWQISLSLVTGATVIKCKQ